MGGTGVQALFDNPSNIYLYVRAFKGGTYSRIYGTAVHELDSCIGYIERGLQKTPILCTRLREKQEYFWGTYDNLVYVPNQAPLAANQGLPPPPLYTKTGGVNRYQAYENRLIRTKHIVTRSGASREWEHTQRLQGLVLSIWESTKEMQTYYDMHRMFAKERFGNAQTANSALQNLLRREATEADARQMMGNDAYRMITDGRRKFTHSDAEWVFNNGRHEFCSLDDISVSEDIFLRAEVSSEETFKVGGITLRPFTGRGKQLLTTRINVGLWQINQSMYEWADALTQRLTERRQELGRPLHPQEAGVIFDADPEWVNDDSGLIARCLREHQHGAGRTYSVIVITADKRLCNQMAETANVTVLRLLPESAISMSRKLNLDPESLDLGLVLSSVNTGELRPDALYIDTGALAAYTARLQLESGRLVRRQILQTGYDEETLARKSRVRLTYLPEEVKHRLFRHYPILRPKVWRSGSRVPSSTYSEHSSWRRSDASSRSFS
jgi:hypothetical protein